MASLRGRVIEFYTGRGVDEALVTLDSFTTLTDREGYFTFPNISIGRHNLQVVHRSFQTYGVSLTLSQNIAYNLAEPIRIQSVVRAL